MNELLLIINNYTCSAPIIKDIIDFPEYSVCSICKYKSGTSREVVHYYDCIHKIPDIFPLVYEKQPIILAYFRSEKLVYVNMREYGIVDSNSDKKIIGSSGAGTCFILCMRNRETTKTMVAHIDALTLFPLDRFREHFTPEITDVYIVGGNNSSIRHFHDIFMLLYFHNFNIMYMRVIENETNRFFINSVNGSVSLDNIIPVNGTYNRVNI